MCCQKTGIWGRSNRGLSADFTFGQLLDNAPHFRTQIAAICKPNRANARRSVFDKRAEDERVVKQDFLHRFFLRGGTNFDDYPQ